jgi:cytochrome c oxidase cbb3-type subunit I/II
MFHDTLSQIHFWGWQLIIVAAALTLPMGFTQGKEYAELEWPIDLAITLVWVVFAINFFGALVKRREKHLYVAIWFYIATIVTVAILHLINSISIPVSAFKSYSAYAGVQDALIQWWYGHNAVAFFLTTPFLGLMYYYLPKAAERPVYSYRLSIVHFWSLVFIYIWAGPHHLLYTAVPDWAQTLGMVFSLMLWAPSWGGMINGLLTLRGSWNRVRQDPILKMMVAAVTFYGMSTFEGPLLSIKSVSMLAHYSDWIIAHVHGGALGWNGFLSFAMIYWMVPKLWRTKLYSTSLANVHFWFGTLGILLYMLSMWTSGITQGSMLLAVDGAGKLLHPDFVATVQKVLPLYAIRAFGGGLFLVGFLVMCYNIWKTIKLAPKSTEVDEVVLVPKRNLEEVNSNPFLEKSWNHRWLEGLPTFFTVLVIASVLVGTVVELIPAFVADEYVPPNPKIKPYTALELHGRDLYVREGCYVCHSQMIRPLEGEVLRYGEYSRAEESRYDHPFQWGSRRAGPDLARVGGKYPDLWHYRHMNDPRDLVQGSLMPAYPWLLKKKIDFAGIPKKLKVMSLLGVPYSVDEIREAETHARLQAERIAVALEAEGALAGTKDREIVALIAYLQRLGTDFRSTTKLVEVTK